jgi:tetratricopeptide (TPR) repeat protein
MWRSVRSGMVALLLTGSLTAGQALAANEGQADFDRATEARLDAKTLSDLGEVVRLCESALAKGLDKDTTQLAKELLVSTLIERAKRTTKQLLGTSPLDPNLARYRQFALEDLEKAIKINPQQAEALYLIAQFLPGGDKKRAAKALDDAIRLSANEPALRAQALTLRAELQTDPKKKLADLSEAIRAAPGNAGALRNRALVYADLDQLALALADLKAAIELDPDHVPTHEDQAIVLARMKKYDEALASIEKARKLEPKSPAPLVQRARIHALQTSFKAALEDLEEAFRLDPDNPAALLMRATIYQDMNQNEKALADVDRVLELRPDSPIAMRLRTVLLAGSGKFDLAVKQLEDLMKSSPDDVETQMQLAIFYSADKKSQKAIETYDAILKRHPDNWQAVRGRADTLLTTGKHAEAIADFEKGLKLRPKDPGMLNNLAWVLATSPDDKLRNGKRAIELAKSACEVTQYKQAHILSTLAAAYAETGDFKTAIEWSEKAVQQGKDDQKAALSKELASYRAGKPWREMQIEPEPLKPEHFRPKKPETTEPKKPAQPTESKPAPK